MSEEWALSKNSYIDLPDYTLKLMMRIQINKQEVAAWVFAVFALMACTNRESESSAVELAISSFQLPEEFKIELLASEPLIADPVDMEIDEFGRLYVVEMPGYPLDLSGTGKIKLLSDTDGDGRMDGSVVFAENLILPTSLMRWKRGILVTDAPYVLYFEDRNNDGRAEIRDTVLTGFARSNPQHNLNSPLLGIDNWIYLAHEGAISTDTYQEEFGDIGTEIYFPEHPSSPRLAVNANGRSVRFRPDSNELEETSGYSQFGHTFDTWGHHFLVGNANHIFQEIIAQEYLGRNKGLLLSEATASISDHGEACEIFPITENPQHQLLTDVGVITSACGLTFYQGGAFPQPYDENVTFVAEPVSNLVHVDKLQADGVTFLASRISEHQEFLASRDPKFRPVNLYIGPDGALYVVDYYRQIIEHPEWMGEEVIRSGELYKDADRGRIYRITAKDAPKALWTNGLSLGNSSSSELVNRLSDRNIWYRMNAQRLLIDRQDPASKHALREMAANDSSAVGRLHSLWTLEGMNALETDLIGRALGDPEAGVRENAIRLAELHLKERPELGSHLFPLANDSDPKVRFQLLCTIGSINTVEANRVRKQILFNNINDPWIQIAALSASSYAAPALLDEALNRANRQPEEYRTLIERLSAIVGADTDGQYISYLISRGTKSAGPKDALVQASILNGLANGMTSPDASKNISAMRTRELVTMVLNPPSPEAGRAALRLLAVKGLNGNTTTEEAAKTASLLAVDYQQPDDRRTLSVALLSLIDPSASRELFMKLFVPSEPLSVQLAALKGLSATRDTSVSNMLVEKWSTLTPELQDAAVATFLEDERRVAILLDAIEANKIAPTTVSWPRRVGLMAQSNQVLRDKARVLFTANDEDAIRSRMSGVLSLKGDATKGQAVYQQHCSLCHQIRGTMGLKIGPDLGTVHNWSAEAILLNTVNPGQSISSGFDLWNVELSNGATAQGIIASETPAAITLRNNGAADKTINRQNIRTLRALNMSIMPADFAQKLDDRQMADLLAFLKKNK